MLPSVIHTLTLGKTRWLNAVSPEDAALQYLAKTFRLNPRDIEDCKPELQRPKVIARPRYLFAIFLFPVREAQAGIIEQKEVDFFVFKNTIITIHDSRIPELENFFTELASHPKNFPAFAHDTASLLFQIIDELIDTSFPILQNLSTAIDESRTKVLGSTLKRAFVSEILRLKNNIVSFRKATQPTQGLLERMMHSISRYLRLSADAQLSFDRLIDHTVEIKEHLEIYEDAIDAIEDTHATMISFRLNDIVRVLTVFSVILLSLTLFTNLFIIDAVDRPIIGSPFDWWALLGIMTLGALIAIGIFKKKKWL